MEPTELRPDVELCVKLEARVKRVHFCQGSELELLHCVLTAEVLVARVVH